MIIRTRGGQDVESRAFALTDMVRYGYSGLRNLSNSTGIKSVRGIPAINRAARLRAEAVASLRLKVWRGEDTLRTQVSDSWQARLFAAERQNEYQSRFAFWETVEESLAYRGNAYIWKLAGGGRVIRLYALHPDQVVARDDESYVVTVVKGYVDPVGRGPAKYVEDAGTILHVRGHGDGGRCEAPSPIEVFREALAAPVARQRHETRMWQKGTALQIGVTFPPGVTQSQAEEWKELWQETYEGPDGGTTAVVGGGATLTPIGMTARDAQFVNLAHLTIEDASFIMGVPAPLLGVQLNRTQDLEHELGEWLRFGLGPGLERIESAINADQDLFGSTFAYSSFDTSEFIRGDMLTEAQVMHMRIQDGTLLPDEARHQLGLEPLPGGVGQIPQVTPVGGAQNNGGAAAGPNATLPAIG